MKILVQDALGLRSLEEGYADEPELQRFLKEHPDLLPLEELQLNAPRLLCIGWEVGVLSGAEDILYIDIAERFFASANCATAYAGLTFEGALRKFLKTDAFSYERFLTQIEEHIKDGRFRLIIAIDEVPPPLARTVEFVNRFSEHFDLYLLQIKRFGDIDKAQNIFVPALFGAVAPVERPRATKDLTEEEFFRQLREVAPNTESIMHELLDVARQAEGLCWLKGSFALRRWDIPAYYATTKGTIAIDVSKLKKQGMLDLINAFRTALGDVPGLPLEVITKDTWTEFNAGLLANDDAMKAFKHAVGVLHEGLADQH